MPFEIVVTNDDADLELLSLANEKGKFAIELGYRLEPHKQYALERGIDAEWFRIVDVSPIAVSPGRLMRIFKLTEQGKERLAALKQAMPEALNAGDNKE